MRFRTLAGAMLLTLQAFVAARPFAALPAGPDAVPIAAHHVATAAELPCHHGAESPAVATPPANDPAQSVGDHGQHPAPAPAHDHDSTACHAGTPCCAPTLPAPPTAIPATTVAHVAPRAIAPTSRAPRAAIARRLPPATAPPALS